MPSAKGEESLTCSLTWITICSFLVSHAKRLELFFSCMIIGVVHCEMTRDSVGQLHLKSKWEFRFCKWFRHSDDRQIYAHVTWSITFESVYEIHKCDIEMKLLSSTFLCWYLLCCTRAIQLWVCVWNPCGTLYYAVQGGSNVWVCGWDPYVLPFNCKATEQHFLCWGLLYCIMWFELSSPWMKSSTVTIQMKATKQYFSLVFVMLFKAALTFEILKGNHWNERYWAVVSCGDVY